MKKINVLSLFDGMSCGRIALDKLGIEVNKYFAAEVDKYAMKVSAANYPEIIQLGDVQFITKHTFGQYKIDLLIGGSPCQGFSMAGKQLNFEDPRSKLFFDYVRLLKDLKPKYFLLENVKMKKTSQAIITEYLGIEPIEINSALVSAQNRKRLYWTNIPGITQPEDKGILLKDVLEDKVDISFYAGKKLQDGYKGGNQLNPSYKSQANTIHEGDKIGTICSGTHGYANGYISQSKYFGAAKWGRTEEDKKLRKENMKKGVDYTPYSMKEIKKIDYEKSNTLTTNVQKDNILVKNETLASNGKTHCITARYTGAVAWNSVQKSQRSMIPTKEENTDNPNNYNGLTYRKLTPLECERLQTVPDGYTNHVSNSQRYKMLGNGWTIDVIAHILKNMEL